MATSETAAAIFAALGDPTRLSLFAALGDGAAHSITELADDAPVTRQAVTKHLKALERAGLVASARNGREIRFVMRREAIDDAKGFLNHIGAQWDGALDRLKAHVETGEA